MSFNPTSGSPRSSLAHAEVSQDDPSEYGEKLVDSLHEDTSGSTRTLGLPKEAEETTRRPGVQGGSDDGSEIPPNLVCDGCKLTKDKRENPQLKEQDHHNKVEHTCKDCRGNGLSSEDEEDDADEDDDEEDEEDEDEELEEVEETLGQRSSRSLGPSPRRAAPHGRPQAEIKGFQGTTVVKTTSSGQLKLK